MTVLALLSVAVGLKNKTFLHNKIVFIVRFTFLQTKTIDLFFCQRNQRPWSLEVHDRDPGRVHPSPRADLAGTHSDSHASFRVQAFLASRVFGFLPRMQLSKYRGAPLYGSVPINHLAHGPTIRLLERGSYYPARLWWCTTSRVRLWILSLCQTIASRTKISQNVLRSGRERNFWQCSKRNWFSRVDIYVSWYILILLIIN